MNKIKKQLYQIYATRTINGHRRIFCGRLHYGAIPENHKKEYTNFSEAFSELGDPNGILHCFCYKKRNPFNKKETHVIEFTDDNGKLHLVKEKSFKNASLKIEYLEESPSYTVQYLAKELTSDEFFEYIKDNLFEEEEESNEQNKM